jgi:hypothetical protein
MSPHTVPAFRERALGQLSIEDERSFRHVALYADLKEILVRDRYVFRTLPEEQQGRWDRALLLNLTYWGGAGGDVLESERISADVVAHAAWHHLANGALGASGGAPATAQALFLGESIASAFDIYLVGRLIGHAPRSSFLETQVSAMAQTSNAAGLAEADFESLLDEVARDPEGAFRDLRELLYDASLALLSCRSADDALTALVPLDAHRFGSLLHHYELSNWVLYARAHASREPGPDARVLATDESLRATRDPLAWLMTSWVAPALVSSGGAAGIAARGGETQ